MYIKDHLKYTSLPLSPILLSQIAPQWLYVKVWALSPILLGLIAAQWLYIKVWASSPILLGQIAPQWLYIKKTRKISEFFTNLIWILNSHVCHCSFVLKYHVCLLWLYDFFLCFEFDPQKYQLSFLKK